MIRLLPHADADGARNMAADETLLFSAVAGIASLRLYGWTTATVSLGYFQPAAVRHGDSRLAILPWVRRPSGGATLVHHHELTYALALPTVADRQRSGPWLSRMHRIITSALQELGLRDRVASAAALPPKSGEVLCFQQFTAGDLLCLDKKIVGSAQRKHRQALLQHGSILLAQSEHTPDLPGVYELTGIRLTPSQVRDAMLHAFAQDTGWHIEPGNWTDDERIAIDYLSARKYGSSAWNERR